MLLKRKIFHDCTGNPRVQKAVSLALLLKHRLGRTSTLHNWSTNKLHDVAGVSASTIKKYMPIMKSMGLVHFCGKNNQHLVVSKISSHCQGRNINISKFDFSSFKEIHNCLRAFLALAIQARKDFIRRTIHALHNPTSSKMLKRARSKMRRLVKRGVVSGMDAVFEDHGISHARIARETGNCLRTAHSIIEFAIKKRWWKKEKHELRVLLSGIAFRDTGGLFTYTTKNYLVVSLANTYTLTKSIYNSIYPWGYSVCKK